MNTMMTGTEPYIEKRVDSNPQRVLLCGHRSFAARGLAERLLAAGHQVVCFSRGPESEKDDIVSGPVTQIHTNSHLSGTFDTLINYILLKDESPERNLEFLESLVTFCRDHRVKHVIHISSMSVYEGGRRVITEETAMGADARHKGNYGRLKIISDQFLEKHLPSDTRLTEVRPGFILGPGCDNPIVGMGLQLPGNRILTIGNDRRQMPLISRDLLNQALLRLLANPSAQKKEVLLVSDPQSPDRRDYLEGCCRELGCGEKVVHLPNVMWLALALSGEIFLTLIGKRKRIFAKIKGACETFRFDSHGTEKRLGLSLAFDWRKELRDSLAGQESPPLIRRTSSATVPTTRAKKISYLGFGNIVKQKHLPALKHIGFNGIVSAYDLRKGTDRGYQIQSIDQAPLAEGDLIVVATPGPLHSQAIAAIQGLQGSVIVEKPLCYNTQELGRWKSFAASRKAPVVVCHNYRYKTNVSQMIRHLNRYNPGQLLQVDVDFQSPPVQSTAAAWARNERQTRTLLMDFGIHFLDLACMFDEGPWQVSDVRTAPDRQKQTLYIEGRIVGARYPVSFFLRQGFGLRRSQLKFNFQNYSVQLGFFPETCVISVSNDWFPVLGQAPGNLLKALGGKFMDRIRGRDSDLSHAMVYTMALGEDATEPNLITIEKLEPFYRMIIDLGDRVYQSSQSEGSNT